MKAYLRLVAVLCMMAIAASAQVPQLINYQGRLLIGTNLANGNVGLSLRLFNVPSGGTVQYEDSNTVTVVDGLYSTFIGDNTTAGSLTNALTNATVWIEVAVNGTALTPREQLGSVPYSLKVTATGIVGTIADTSLSTNIARLNSTNLVFSGGVSFAPNATLTGNFSGTFSGNGAAVSNVDLHTANTQGAITWSTNVAFILSSSPAVGTNPNSVVVADVNGDGKPDLISVNTGEGTFSVLTNNGRGMFLSSATYKVSGNLTSVVAADVNSDGKLDLICTSSGFLTPSSLTVFTNNGSGVFSSNATYTVGSNQLSVVAADVNRDGKPDLICANTMAGMLTVLTNNGSGAFSSNATYRVGSNLLSVVAADVNGDGAVDLICANYKVTGSTLTVLMNFGGVFFSNATYRVGGSPSSVVAADVNGDGMLDLICSDYSAGTLSVLMNNGSGGFFPDGTLEIGYGCGSIAAADVTGDGLLDVICANSVAGMLSVLVNSGGGGFTLTTNLTVGASPFSVAAADVNGDGRMDLISANSGDNTLSVLLNAPTFSAIFAGNGSHLTDLVAANIASAPWITNNQTGVSLAGTLSGNGSGLAGLVHTAGDTMTGALNLPAGGLTVGSSQLVVPAGGGVGIGTASMVEGDLCVNTNMSLFSHALYLRGDTGADHNHGLAYCGTGVTNFGPVLPDGPVLWGWSGGALGAANATPHAVLTWLANGNVGIGTASPGTKLDVRGNGADVRLQATSPGSSSYIEMDDSASSIRALMGVDGSGYSGTSNQFTIGTWTTHPIKFFTDTHERMAITAGGNVGIGTASPRQALDVNGEFMVVEGLGNEQVYIGGDNSGNDAQIGSLNNTVTSVVAWNAATSAYMNFRCSSITIEGGSDLAEPFSMSEDHILPGSVVVIDSRQPGRLKLSTQACDKCVAGVVSGANGIHPGISMQQDGLQAGGQNIALSGRVYVLADASTGPIEPGDMLTTSDIPGHAMKASDLAKAHGAIIGKAMSSLQSGQGYVLVLVTLQ